MIEIENLWYVYESGFTALKGVSIQISNGEYLAIMGKNGAGKTTLAKHLNGLLKPTRGYVLIDGMDTRDYSVAQLSRKVGYVFQNPDRFLFAESVEKELMFTLKNLGFSESEIPSLITRTLNDLNLSQFRNRSPFSLSGGERRRVALAAILCANPDYIVLDEPTVGQDFYEKERLAALLERLNKKDRRAVIVISHDVEFVADHIPRTITMCDGLIVSDGPTNKVLTNQLIIERSNLKLPQISELFTLLHEKNSHIPRDIVNIEQALEAFNKLTSSRKR
ncbi:MAG: energy-coupling factor ABC transporter ATP-binding protein [Candidatus Asgardarchaeia archaeon]